MNLLHFQDIGCFASIHPKLRGVGLASVFATFLIVTYYTVIISYANATLGALGLQHWERGQPTSVSIMHALRKRKPIMPNLKHNHMHAQPLPHPQPPTITTTLCVFHHIWPRGGRVFQGQGLVHKMLKQFEASTTEKSNATKPDLGCCPRSASV